MKRTLGMILPFAVAFGLSLGVSTGIVMMRAPKAVTAKAIKGAAHKDSTHVTAPAAPVVPASAPAPVAPAVGTSTTTPGAATPVTTAPVATAPVANGVASKDSVHPTVTKDTAKIASHSIPVTPVQKPGVAATQPRRATDSTAEKRLAKVFAAMQPRDAARVLAQMDDNDIQVILTSLSNKQQAAILGNFPVTRAATIARATLRNTGVSQ